MNIIEGLQYLYLTGAVFLLIVAILVYNTLKNKK